MFLAGSSVGAPRLVLNCRPVAILNSDRLDLEWIPFQEYTQEMRRADVFYMQVIMHYTAPSFGENFTRSFKNVQREHLPRRHLVYSCMVCLK